MLPLARFGRFVFHYWLGAVGCWFWLSSWRSMPDALQFAYFKIRREPLRVLQKSFESKQRVKNFRNFLRFIRSFFTFGICKPSSLKSFSSLPLFPVLIWFQIWGWYSLSGFFEVFYDETESVAHPSYLVLLAFGENDDKLGMAGLSVGTVCNEVAQVQPKDSLFKRSRLFLSTRPIFFSRSFRPKILPVILPSLVRIISPRKTCPAAHGEDRIVFNRRYFFYVFVHLDTWWLFPPV